MYRRDFLKLSGFLSAAVIIRFDSLGKAVSLPLEVEAQGMLFRSTPDGKIYVSGNAGKDWQLHTNFGRAFYISSLAKDGREQVSAELAFEGRSFQLALTKNGRSWMTV